MGFDARWSEIQDIFVFDEPALGIGLPYQRETIHSKRKKLGFWNSRFSCSCSYISDSAWDFESRFLLLEKEEWTLPLPLSENEQRKFVIYT